MSDTAMVPPQDDTDNFVFVRFPDGTTRAVPKEQVQNLADFQVREDPVPEEDPDVYVHLASGEVLRMKSSELIERAGTRVPQHLVNDGMEHPVIGVFPVEVKTSSR
jgi:hypothetical protein